MNKTKITLVRHGETEWNVAMRLQGTKNSPLTENGIKQAELVAEALSQQKFHRLISSDLDRALKTAAILNIYHHLQIEEEPALRERNFGIMEGLTRDEILIRYPDVFNGYMDRKDSYLIPKGETLTEFYNRVTVKLKSIVKENEGMNLLLVSHGGVLDCIMRLIFDYPLSSPRRFSIYNGSINTFSVTDNEWFLEQWGNIDHQQIQSISLGELKR